MGVSRNLACIARFPIALASRCLDQCPWFRLNHIISLDATGSEDSLRVLVFAVACVCRRKDHVYPCRTWRGYRLVVMGAWDSVRRTVCPKLLRFDLLGLHGVEPH